MKLNGVKIQYIQNANTSFLDKKAGKEKEKQTVRRKDDKIDIRTTRHR